MSCVCVWRIQRFQIFILFYFPQFFIIGWPVVHWCALNSVCLVGWYAFYLLSVRAWFSDFRRRFSLSLSRVSFSAHVFRLLFFFCFHANNIEFFKPIVNIVVVSFFLSSLDSIHGILLSLTAHTMPYNVTFRFGTWKILFNNNNERENKIVALLLFKTVISFLRSMPSSPLQTYTHKKTTNTTRRMNEQRERITQTHTHRGKNRYKKLFWFYWMWAEWNDSAIIHYNSWHLQETQTSSRA